MYKEKFNYTPLSRQHIDGQRRYLTPNGAKLPSVTTILEATKSEEKKQVLKEWRNKVGVEKAQQITTEAANRGTRMHSYLEEYIKYGKLRDRGTNPFSWPSYEMAKTVIKNGLTNVNEFWGIEVPLFFPDIYAGTTDCVGIHNNQESILDFKQTNKPKKREWIEDYFLQLAAYAEAHNELHGTNIRRGVVLMCVKPHLDEHHNILSSPEYQEFLLEGEEFEHYRSIWWKRVEQFYLL